MNKIGWNFTRSFFCCCSMTTWRWVNDDRFLIFGLPIPLTSRTNGPDKGKMDTYRLYTGLTSLKPSACMSGTWRLKDEALWGEEHPPCVLFSFSATFYLISRWAREAWWRFLWTANQPAITAGDSCTQTGSKTLPRSALMLCKCKQLSFLKPPSLRFPPVWRSKGFQSVCVFFFSLLFFNPSPIITNKPRTTKTTLQNKQQENEREESKQGVDERLSAGTWSCETY